MQAYCLFECVCSMTTRQRIAEMMIQMLASLYCDANHLLKIRVRQVVCCSPNLVARSESHPTNA
jgi:hypothetical protein